MVDEITYPPCEICKNEPGVVVNSMPGIPFSISRGQNCIDKELSYTYWALVAETSLTGGMEHAADWWKEEVEFHLPHFNKTMAEFLDDVNKEIQAEIEFWREQERKENGLGNRSTLQAGEQW